jgi:hypothetical protein
VCIYTGADPLQNETATLKIQRMNNLGIFDDAFVAGVGQLILTEKNLCVAIDIVGTYRVYRPNISYFGTDIGVQIN